MALTAESKQRLEDVRDDCFQDTKNLEGQPVTGRVIAEQFGYIRAQIAAICQTILDESDR